MIEPTAFRPDKAAYVQLDGTQTDFILPICPLRIIMPAPPSFMLGPKEMPPEVRPSQSQSSFVQGG